MYLQAITLHILPSPTIASAYLHTDDDVSLHFDHLVQEGAGKCSNVKTMNTEHSMPSAQLEYITNLIPNSLHFFLLGSCSCSCMFILFILLPFASCYTFLISVAFGNYGLEQPPSGTRHWMCQRRGI